MPADPSDLCTIADVKVAMEMSGSDTSLDTRLQAAVTAVSGELMRRLERELVPQTAGATRRFRLQLGYGVPTDPPRLNLGPFEIRTVTTVVLHPEQATPVTLTASDWATGPQPSRDGSFLYLELNPYLAYASQFLVRFGQVQVDITGDWGLWTTGTIPQWVKDQVALAVRARVRQSAVSDVYSQNTDGGQVTTAPPPVYGLPNATMQAFAHMQRWMP